MTRRVVITGAHSYLGRRALDDLLARPGTEVHALTTPWSAGLTPAPAGPLHCVQADLTRPLSEEVASLLASADRVLHFAWVRGRDKKRVAEANERMAKALLAPLASPARFVFISSVSAAPGAWSCYAAAKYTLTEWVRAAGGSTLVCGLVVEDNPQGPYKMLCRVLRALPLSPRLSTPPPQVYPVHIDDVVACVRHVVETDVPAGTYRMFADGVSLNDVIAQLEARYPRVRLRLPLRAGAVLRMVALLKSLRVAPSALCDKVLTFLYKDDQYVRQHQPLPGLCFRSWAEVMRDAEAGGRIGTPVKQETCA